MLKAASCLKIMILCLLLNNFQNQLCSQSIVSQNKNDNYLKRLSVKDSLWEVYNNPTNSDTNRIKTLQRILWTYMSTKPDTSFILAKQELILTQLTKHKVLEGRALIDVGAALQTIGNFDEALVYYLKAIKIFENENNKRGLGAVCNNIGLLHQNQANYPEALKYYLRSLHTSEEIGDKLVEGKALTNIGALYYFQKEYDKATNYYEKGILINKEIKNKSAEALCYSNLGIIYKYKLNFKKALEYYLMSLNIRAEIGDKSGVAACYINIGGNFQDQKKYEEALQYYLKAIATSKEIGKKPEMCVSYLNLSVLCNELLNYKNAVRYSDSALKIAKEMGDINNERLGYEILSNIYARSKNFEEAYNYQIKFKKLTDSIYNADNSKQLGDLKTQYEVDKKATELKLTSEAEKKVSETKLNQEKTLRYFLFGGLILVLAAGITFLNQRNKQKKLSEQLQLINEELKKINDSKTKLFSIIGHDIKSPMASIQGYTELIADNSISFTETEIKEFAKTMNLSVKNLNAMLDNILLWALNESKQLKTQFNVLSINDVITSCIGLLAVNSLKKNIKVVYTSNVVQNIESDKNILTTVIRNILSNAIKFSQHDSEIKINSKIENHQLVISISDSGVGMNAAQIDNVLKHQKQESTLGTANEKGNGLGLFLCNEFMLKLEGDFLIESEPGNGTTVILKLNITNFS